MTDLDQGGFGFQRVRTYLGPTLGWKDELVKPSTDVTTPGVHTVLPGESLLLVEVAAAVTIQLPDVVKWIQQPGDQPATGFERSITIKDIGGNAHNFNILISPFGQQTIDNIQQGVIIQEARGTIKLLPLNDLTGWVVETTGTSGGGGGGGGDVFKAGNNTYTGTNTFTNTTQAVTEPVGDNSTKVATTGYVQGNLIHYQPQDDDLGVLASLTGTNTIYYRSGNALWSQVVMGANMTFAGGVLSSTGGSGGGGAPTDAEYITSTANAALSAERVLADSASITWDRTVAGQISANSLAGGGNVNSVPTPSNNQIAVWTGATTIKGMDPTLLGFQAQDDDLTAISGLLGTNTIYYRSASAIWSPVAFSGLTFSGGILTVTTAGGNVSNVGTPATDQIAVWTDATHIKGAAVSSLNVVAYNYIAGLTLSNAADPINDIAVQPGQAASSDNSQMMTLPAQITKQIDAAWAQGDNQGGRDGSALADGTWHVYLIWNPTGPVADVIFSVNQISPGLPSGFTKFRRIGSIIRQTAAILPFKQNGQYFYWQTPQADFNTGALGTRQLFVLTVPTNILPIAIVRVDCVHSTGSVVVICDPAEPDLLPAPAASPGITIRGVAVGSGAEIQVRTSAIGQIAARANVGSTTLRGVTVGWIDSRGSGTQESGTSVLAQNGFRVDKNGTNQTGIASGTATKVTFSNTVFDVGSYFDLANNRWRPPAGLVHLDANVDILSGLTASNAVLLHIYKNGVAYISQRILTPTTTGASQISVSDKADGNDYYEVWVTLVTGTTATIDGTAARTWFSGTIPGGQAGPPGPVGSIGPQGIPGTNGGEWSTGDVKMTLKTVADANWLMMDDGTIGSPASGASSLASNTSQLLFNLLFNNVADTQCPIQTITGAATTRAAQGNAATAWSNNCRIVLPRVLGRALAGAGTGAGLSVRALAAFAGAQTITPDTNILAAHNHTLALIAAGNQATTDGTQVVTGAGASTTTSNQGNSAPFGIVQPTTFLNVMIRL